VAELLLQKEKIRGEDLEAVLGPRPFKDTALEDIRHLLPAGYDEMEKAREKLFHDERVPTPRTLHSSHSVFPLRLECAKLQNSGVQQQLTAAPLSSSSFAGAHPAARAGAPGSRRVINASQRDTAPALMTMSSTFLRPV
jgi:hypothetical protein